MLKTVKNTDILRANDGDYVHSYYSDSAVKHETFPTLNGDRNADVCIIGGGFTGLSAAIHLAEQGFDVVLLEAERIGWGASGRNGGHAGVGQRVEQQSLETKYGLDRAKSFWSLGLEAVDLIRNLVTKHEINCDLKEGILHLAAKITDVEYLKKSTEKLRNDYGYKQISFIEKAEVDAMVGSKKYFAGQMDRGSVHLHPLNFALGLAKTASKLGASLYEQSRVINYQKSNSHSTVVQTSAGRVYAKNIVLACNGYLGKLEPKMAGKIMPINNFMLATEPLNDELAREIIRDDVAVQDTLFVINYWKLSADNRLLFGGGENYSSRFPSDLKAFVRKYMLRVYPQLESTRIDYAWGGTLAITMNRMPHLGLLNSNIYYAQGYSGHGLPTAILAGKLICEAICGDAQRFKLFADLPPPSFPGGTFLRKPGLIAGMLYYSLLDKF